MLPVRRRDVNAVALALLQFENGPEFPQPRQDVGIAALGRPDHWHALFLDGLAGGVGRLEFGGEGFDLFLVLFRFYLVGLVRQVLLPDEVPGNHAEEHE